MNKNKIFSFDCNTCLGVCDNYANNLMVLYYEYWLSKVEIKEDPKGHLTKIFDILNFKRMKNGITCIVLNYFNNDIVIGNMVGVGYDLKWDHNGQPIGAKVQITKNNFDFQEIYIIDWKLNKKENETLKNAYLETWGWKSVKNIYETIFFINNITWSPSLQPLNSILFNIHKLAEANDKNQCVLNCIYVNSSDKKPTIEEAQNTGIVFTKDGFGAWIIDWNTANVVNNTNITKEVKLQNLSNWSGIKDEMNHWKSEFFEFAGLPIANLSANRENISETISKFSRVNAKEKQYYKYIELFIKEYEEYYNVKVSYQFDNLVQNMTNSAISSQNQTSQKIESQIENQKESIENE